MNEEERDDCNNKRLEACAYIIEPSIAADLEKETQLPAGADLLLKHDYRDIKVTESMTITIDLEEIKKEFRNRLNPFQQNFLQNGG
ncbi:MAG: hypothetical protein FWD71_17110 [Oscillospiraceae bacterium]|nr:hypothetical protein [Oscillospiraceae bacterium]